MTSYCFPRNNVGNAILSRVDEETLASDFTEIDVAPLFIDFRSVSHSSHNTLVTMREEKPFSALNSLSQEKSHYHPSLMLPISRF